MDSIDKSIYNEFHDYLTEGANQVVEINRQNLDGYIRDSIDISKSEEIIKKHKKEGENFVVSPETFLALGLVDDIPQSIDLRFAPEFKLDGVVFKHHKNLSKQLALVKVPYSEKIQNILKLQIAPDAEAEMLKSSKYADNMITNIQLFDKAYRASMDFYTLALYRRIKMLVNKPSVFFDSVINCVCNDGRSYTKRIRQHRVPNIKYQKWFCLEFNRSVEYLKSQSPSEVNQENVYKIIYSIIINKIFPKLSDEDKEKIFFLLFDLKEPIDYNVIRKIIKQHYRVNSLFADCLDLCKDKGTVGNEKFLVYDLLQKNKPLKRVLLQSKLAVNNHSFYNLILFINRCRHTKELNVRKGRADTDPFVYTELIDFCSSVIGLDDMKYFIDENSKSLLKDLHPQFCEYLNKTLFWEKLRKGIDLGVSRFKKILIERFLKALYPSVNTFKRKANRTFILNKDRNRVYTPEFISLMKKNKEVIDFFRQEKAWSYDDGSSDIYEIASVKPLSNIQRIGGKNVLNFLFRGQDIESDYFQDVEYVLFHENMVLVRKNGELQSLAPSEGYKQFVLNKIGAKTDIAVVEDIGGVQLDRITKVLNDVIQEKTKESFDGTSGDVFINSLSKAINVKFINTIELENNGTIEHHKVSLGSISESEQEAVADFFKSFHFIFPAKISEIQLSTTLMQNRSEIPSNNKELMFYIEKRKNDRDRDTKFVITQEDIILLSRVNRFYTPILIERAFGIIFNKEILNNDVVFSEFKNAIGNKNIEFAKRHFAVRGQSISESRIIRKVFIQNAMLFIQDKKEQLSQVMIDFIGGILKYNKQIA